MSMTTEAGLNTLKLSEISELVKRAGEEAVRLRVVERFLSEVERRLLKSTPQIFDIERVRTALQILKTLTEEDDIDECLEAEFRLDQEFQLWRELIIERDRKIETYHFRRLCDSSPYPLDDEVYVALAAFYRSLEFTPAVQSKFDLSVTRLFSRGGSGGQRQVKGSRDEIVTRLEQLLPSVPAFGSGSPDDIRYAVNAIDGFTDEAVSLKSFEDLVRANIFDRYRVFKRELGLLFFDPQIVAAAIECNVTVGNVFDQLLRSADEQLSSRLTVDVDLAAALHDPSPESRSHINDLFRVFFGETEASVDDPSEDADYLGKLLSASSPNVASRENEQSTQDSTSAQGRLAPFLRTLTEARPDTELLLRQMQRSESLKNLDLSDFLYESEGAPDVLARRALGLILWSLEFRENELKHSRELTEAIQREATSLLFKAEHLAASLTSEIERADEPNENRLRAVLNALMDSRLKLERGIVRFTNRKIAAAESAAKAESAALSDNVGDRSLVGTLVRWAIIGAVLIAAAAGVFGFLQKQFGEVLGTEPNLSEIDIRTLPNNDFMRSAYRNDRTLFITAREGWIERTPEERAETLQVILNAPRAFKYRTIVVLNEAGVVLENVSRDATELDQVSTGPPAKVAGN